VEERAYIMVDVINAGSPFPFSAKALSYMQVRNCFNGMQGLDRRDKKK
jgi:hypothetical protein